MPYKKTKLGKIVVGRMPPNVDLIKEVINLCKKYKIASGFIPTFFGGLREVTLVSMQEKQKGNLKTFHKKEKKYIELLECIGTGNIACKNGEIIPHIHLFAAHFGNNAIGGHLVSGITVVTFELAIAELKGINMIRKQEKDILNFQLLNFK